jgi:hypothetical protein
VGIILFRSQSPTEMLYDLGTPLGTFLVDIPNDRKSRIAFVVPVWNLLKEEVETLSLPLVNKRAKSPTSVAIPRREGGQGKGGRGGRGGRGGWKPYVKKEAIKDEEEEKAIVDKEEEEEEVEEDSDFLEANDLFTRKRKQNSMYLAN